MCKRNERYIHLSICLQRALEKKVATEMLLSFASNIHSPLSPPLPSSLRQTSKASDLDPAS